LATTPLLVLEVTQAEPGVVAIRCTGEIDLASVDQLEEAIDWSYTPELETLRIDLSAVTFIDSSVIRCLIDAHGRCSRLATRFEVVGSDRVNRTFRLVDVRFQTPRARSADGRVKSIFAGRRTDL
jgi:anti-anti-sigma factor